MSADIHLALLLESEIMFFRKNLVSSMFAAGAPVCPSCGNALPHIEILTLCDCFLIVCSHKHMNHMFQNYLSELGAYAWIRLFLFLWCTVNFLAQTYPIISQTFSPKFFVRTSNERVYCFSIPICGVNMIIEMRR